jgi:hypothetical protein
VIFWRRAAGDSSARPFIVLDVAHDPARLEVSNEVTACADHVSGELHDQGPEGLVVCLGTKDDRIWGLLVDGGERRPPLPGRKREDILFLAGECAGLLFLRDFAGEAED